ncbi:carboxylesterase family protein [Nocardia sp. ET3-3]|uniref:Carboxylesterase family protein n=1 Tax=Nocardia terrae TaxID=2675851 RepID=A0A7K1V1X5_9NOCA|nr:carboxylesterase family protein [Nocardia terrae]
MTVFGQSAGTDYRAAYPDLSPAQLYELLHADWLFRMPCLHLADAHHAGGGRPWTYELRWSFNRDEAASHSLDFLLVFGTLTPTDIRNHPSARPTAVEDFERLSHQMRTDWVNFATTGLPSWPHYTPSARLDTPLLHDHDHRRLPRGTFPPDLAHPHLRHPRSPSDLISAPMSRSPQAGRASGRSHRNLCGADLFADRSNAGVRVRRGSPRPTPGRGR